MIPADGYGLNLVQTDMNGRSVINESQVQITMNSNGINAVYIKMPPTQAIEFACRIIELARRAQRES